MAQITINIQTLDWTMGETVGLHFMLKKGSKARIAWGDGKVQVVQVNRNLLPRSWLGLRLAIHILRRACTTPLLSVRKRRMPLSDLMDVACSR